MDDLGTGKVDLFVAAEKGDRLMRWNGDKKAMEDVTAADGSDDEEPVFRVGDFNSDGKLDLTSFDGKEILDCITGQKVDVYREAWSNAGDAFKDESTLGLTTFDSGDRREGPAVDSGEHQRARRWLLTIGGGQRAAAARSERGSFRGRDLGDPAECLVADFDGDGIPDIVQLFWRRAELVLQGDEAGAVSAAAVKIDVAAWRRPSMERASGIGMPNGQLEYFHLLGGAESFVAQHGERGRGAQVCGFDFDVGLGRLHREVGRHFCAGGGF